jgi:type II secretory pathway component GspD/PulD (secretin)
MHSQDTGIYVQVTPLIGTELTDLDIDLRVLNHVGFADNGRPLIVRRTSGTHVKARSGQEVVLGGMVHETVLNTTRKVPILGSIPVVGYLFGGEIKQNQRRLVVVTVCPTYVTDFSGMTDDDRGLIDRAEGKAPIRLPELDVELRGDPPSGDGLAEGVPGTDEGK